MNRSNWDLVPWLHVKPTLSAQRIAARHLIRPHEVAHLIRTLERWELPSRAPGAKQVSRHLRRSAKRLRYIPDPERDIWQSPAQTLARGGGDCEDLAILSVSLLRHVALCAHLVVGQVWQNRRWNGHAWVEGRDSQGWYLLEATNGDVVRGVRPGTYRVTETFTHA